MGENSSSFRRSKGKVLHGNTNPIQRSIIDAFFKEAYFCGKLEFDFNEEHQAEIAQQKATMLHRKLASWKNALRHNPRGREGMLTILVGCRPWRVCPDTYSLTMQLAMPLSNAAFRNFCIAAFSTNTALVSGTFWWNIE
jgi:hypothetical protein